MPRSQSSTNPDRVLKRKDPTGTMRSKSTIRRLQMYKSPGLIRDRRGKVVDGDLLAKDKAGNKVIDGKMARIAPNRKWFGNTRVVGAKELDEFRTEMGKRVADPYSVILKRKKVPMGLLASAGAAPGEDKIGHARLIESESFESTFGPGARRKRAKLSGVSTMEELAQKASAKETSFLEAKEPEPELMLTESELAGENRERALPREEVFDKGQSRRIWTELYKVLDCSDVVIQVLDARDPMGTRSRRVEEHLRKNAPHKSMVLVLNKVDLVPTWVTRRWVRVLSAEYPTLAFHASVTKPFGKGSLIQLLRQFALMHQEKKQISVGIIGYPNAGKSSLINTLSGQKVSHVSPIPGETKVWQYVTLFKRIYLIDCPGVVYESNDSEAEKVFKGVVRAEKLEEPEQYIPHLLKKVRHEYLERAYNCDAKDLVDADTFLKALCRKRGRLRKGGEADKRTVAQSLVFDLQRGKIPYFIPPPSADESESEASSGEEEEHAEDVDVDEEQVEEDVEAGEEAAKDRKLKVHSSKLRLEKQNFDELPQKDFTMSDKNAVTVSWNDLDLNGDDSDDE
jgi:nuclear GTP-binding protein